MTLAKEKCDRDLSSLGCREQTQNLRIRAFLQGLTMWEIAPLLFDYAALGHLHSAQKVGKQRSAIRGHF